MTVNVALRLAVSKREFPMEAMRIEVLGRELSLSEEIV
eukprot:CAMPEP_0172703048 /NCGR_PEP_ID=MMETSP1074-20121228/36789_1 /TAXON_ID=2916 /ORGANISM="Ceratium fusus, Strain PA161109" /LENGTH=37 /DNA_ID= /DNA_START= /DNA_END= /DNA_ORIENTATION=